MTASIPSFYFTPPKGKNLIRNVPIIYSYARCHSGLIVIVNRTTTRNNELILFNKENPEVL